MKYPGAPVDTHDDSASPRRHPAGTVLPCLHVALECDRPLAGSARYALDGVEQVTIGRGEAREATRRKHPVGTLDLRIPGRSMSSTHARLIRVGYSWAVEDLGSRNGTFVDGQRVTHAVLGPESTLQLGHTFMRIRDVALPADAPADLSISGEGDALETVDGQFRADLERLVRLVGSQVPALLLGESGTGKEVLARHLHGVARPAGPFVAVNCGAIPAALMESQLFGHVKGAFSGAVRDTEGFVRAAHGGTLFLDEVADLPRTSQAALLRTLQEREVVPVGTTKPVDVDFQLVAATHQSLEELIERGEFREDLFARLAGCVLEMPPLRDRRDDLGILVAALLRKIAPADAAGIRLTPEVGRALIAYDWPMNVRELERCLTTCVALAVDGEIAEAHLPPAVASTLREGPPPTSRPSSGPLTERDERLRLELLAHLSRHQGNLTDVARAMGKARSQIHRWCKRFSVDPKVFRN
jgi:transcriptional regulator of acetoin/glycerol metabolism